MEEKASKSIITRTDSAHMLPPVERAVVYYQHHEYDKVFQTLKPLIDKWNFEPVYLHPFTMFTDACFQMLLSSKKIDKKKYFLSEARKCLAKTPDSYNSFLYDKGVISYYSADFGRAKQIFRTLFSRTEVLDQTALLPMARIALRLNDTATAKGCFHFLAGSDILAEEVQKLVRGKVPYYPFSDLGEYDLGFGKITLEDMNSAIRFLRLYPKREEGLSEFTNFIIRKNIEFCRASEIDPGSVGKQFFANKNYFLAISAYEAMPESEWSHDLKRDLAYAYYNVGRYTDSIRLYEELVKDEKTPARVKLILEYAEALTCIEEYGAAQKQLAKANEMSPDDPEILYSTGLLNFVRVQNEQRKYDANVTIWSKYLRQAHSAFEKFEKLQTGHVSPEKMSTIKAVKDAWEGYREQKLIHKRN